MDAAPKYSDGPFVQCACICEKVIEDKSNVLSLIRIIDTFTAQITGPDVPNDMPGMQFSMVIVVMLKSGNALGRNQVQIIPELPNGGTLPAINHPVHFEGEERGVNIVMNINMNFSMEGLYWFRVFLADQQITAIPFRVRYAPIRTSTNR